MALSITLSPPVRAKVEAALDALDAAAKRARAAATAGTGGLAAWWQEKIGAESSGSALQARAHAQEVLARDYRTAAGRLQGDAAALAWLRELERDKLGDVSDVEALARSLTITGAAREVGAASVKDAAALAVDVGNGLTWLLRAAPFLLVVLAVFYVWTLGKKARGAVAAVSGGR
jgi:hypothetical protein